MALVKRCVVRCENVFKKSFYCWLRFRFFARCQRTPDRQVPAPTKAIQRTVVEVRSSQGRWTPHRNDLPLRWPAALPTRQRNATPGKRNATQMRPVRAADGDGAVAAAGFDVFAAREPGLPLPPLGRDGLNRQGSAVSERSRVAGPVNALALSRVAL